jgi:hypothetical protein
MRFSELKRVRLDQVPDQGLFYPCGDWQSTTSGTKGCLYRIVDRDRGLFRVQNLEGLHAGHIQVLPAWKLVRLAPDTARVGEAT